MKKLAFIVALPLLLTGCASMHRFSSDIVDKREPLPPYWATGTDLGIAATAPFSDNIVTHGGGGCLFAGLALLDLPIALVSDTVCLPFDGYAYLRYPSDVRFWDDFFTNSTPRVTSRILRRHYTEYTAYVVEEKVRESELSADQINQLLSAGVGVKQLAQTAVTNAETAWALHRYADKVGGDEGYLIQMRLASNPASPEDLLDLYAHHNDLGRVRAAAGNPSIRRETLVELSTSDDMFLLCEIAKNRGTPAEIKHAYLLRDEFMLNRALAESSHTPDEILEILKGSDDRLVLMNLKCNPKINKTQQSGAGYPPQGVGSPDP